MQLLSYRIQNPVRLKVLLATIIALILVGIVVTDLNREYSHEIRASSEKTAVLTTILEATTRQTLRRVDVGLQTVNSEIRHGTKGDALLRFLRSLLVLNDEISAFTIFDDEGRLVTSTRNDVASLMVDIVHADYFASHRLDEHRGLFVGASLKIHGNWQIPVSIRVGQTGEAFQGVIVATISPDFFQKISDAMNTGSNGFTTLFTRDAWIAARSPHIESLITQNWRESPMFKEHLPSSSTKTVRQKVAADGIERIYSYIALPDYPLIVSAGVSITDALAPWRMRLWEEGIALLVIVAALAGFTALQIRNQRLKARIEAELSLTAKSVGMASLPIFWIAPDSRIVRVNQAACELHGYSEDQLLRMRITELDPDFPESRWPEHWRELREKKRMQFETLHKNSAGLFTPVEVELNFVEFEGQEYNFAYVRNISKRKQAEAALMESEHFSRAIADAVPGMLSYWDAQLRCGFANSAYMTWFKHNATDIQGMSVQSLMGEELFKKNEPYMRAALAGHSQQYERSLVNESGETTYLWVQYIPRWQNGSVVGFLSLVTDIADITKTQRRLEILIQEKDALLKEVHHRVKNNLQVIASLLRMEIRRHTLPQVVSVLKSMQGRIYAMAQLHESLYRSGTFASVDLGQYLSQIANETFQTQCTSEQPVTLRLDMGSVRVGMDQAIVLGLIVNELVTNGLKHGFPDGCSGEICVEFKQIESRQGHASPLWQLNVADTGKGWPSDIADKQRNTLGLQLINDLCLQAGGEMAMLSRQSGGALTSIEFSCVAPVPLGMPL